MRKGGKAYIVIGCTGSGKSTLVKTLTAPVDRSRLFINDVNGEYFPDRPYVNTKDFLKIAVGLRESVLVFEEATIFFSNRGSNEQMREILVRKRHAQNVIFLIFHSVRAVPLYIYDLCNVAFVFRTNDAPTFVESRFEHPGFYSGWQKVQAKYFKYGKNVFDYCHQIKLN
jgi:ABC-type cobalamin/Fe3+-siderophores transport system ATPase subunit